MVIGICDNVKACVERIKQLLIECTNGSDEVPLIYEFSNGKELCEFGMENNIDLLFLDIEMDGISGIEVADFFRNKMNNYQIMIVFVTGTTQYDRKLFDYQPFGFLEKPVCIEKLR